MKIISHRGLWQSSNEKNTVSAFEKSFSADFGTETDIRDYKGALVISHDVADNSCLLLSDFFELYKKYDADLPIALNVKADGLQNLLQTMLLQYEVNNYFVFDMSIPDTLGYLACQLNVFCRQSEYEPNPSFYTESKGIWLDGFNGEWFDNSLISNHLTQGKEVCIVSSELHGSNYIPFWKKLRELAEDSDDSLMLCTDYPDQAREFFYGKD